MKSFDKRIDFYLKVNDIFDELKEENKILKNELMFANNYLNVLNKFRLLLSKIYVKFEANIESEDKQQFSQLEEEFNSVFKTEVQKNGEKNHKNIVKVNQSIGDTNNLIEEKIKENSNEIEIKINPLSVESNLRRSGRTGRKLYAIPVKRKLKSSESKPIPKPIKKVIPRPEDEPNSMLLLKRDNYDPKTASYVCPNPYCERSCQTKLKLFKHFKGVHHLKKTYFCDHFNCNKGFKTRQELKAHSIAHSDIKPFVCDFKGCDYRCKTQNMLNMHQISHTENTPFKCNDCEKCFKNQYYLNFHRRLHKIEPTFRCRYEGCHQVFKSYNRLRDHKVLLHNEKYRIYDCDWPGCDYSTRRGDVLAIHKSLHTGERKYVCDWPACGHTFRLKNALDHHIKIHKDLKPYACVWPGCQYRCRQTGNLEKHMKIHRK